MPRSEWQELAEHLAFLYGSIAVVDDGALTGMHRSLIGDLIRSWPFVLPREDQDRALEVSFADVARDVTRHGPVLYGTPRFVGTCVFLSSALNQTGRRHLLDDLISIASADSRITMAESAFLRALEKAWATGVAIPPAGPITPRVALPTTATSAVFDGVAASSLPMQSAFGAPPAPLPAPDPQWWAHLGSLDDPTVEKGAAATPDSRTGRHKRLWDDLNIWVERLTTIALGDSGIPWVNNPNQYQIGKLSYTYWARLYPEGEDALKDAFHVGLQLSKRLKWVDELPGPLAVYRDLPVLTLWASTNDRLVSRLPEAQSLSSAYGQHQLDLLLSHPELWAHGGALVRRPGRRGLLLEPASAYIAALKDGLIPDADPGHVSLFSPLITQAQVEADPAGVSQLVANYIRLLATPVLAARAVNTSVPTTHVQTPRLSPQHSESPLPSAQTSSPAPSEVPATEDTPPASTQIDHTLAEMVKLAQETGSAQIVLRDLLELFGVKRRGKRVLEQITLTLRDNGIALAAAVEHVPIDATLWLDSEGRLATEGPADGSDEGSRIPDSDMDEMIASLFPEGLDGILEATRPTSRSKGATDCAPQTASVHADAVAPDRSERDVILALLRSADTETMHRGLVMGRAHPRDSLWHDLATEVTLEDDGEITIATDSSFFATFDEHHREEIALWALKISGRLATATSLIVKAPSMESLAFLEGLTQLEELHIRNGEFLDEWTGEFIPSRLRSLAHIWHCVALHTLSASEQHALVDFSGLRYCGALEHLSLTNCSGLVDLFPIRLCQRLHTLDVSHCDALTDIRALGFCHDLYQLDINGCVGLPLDSSTVPHMPSLTHLNAMYNPQVNSLEYLHQLPHLQSLAVGESSLVDLRSIPPHLSIVSLDLTEGDSRGSDPTDVLLVSLSGIERLSHLQSLNVMRCNSLESIAPLGQLPVLEAVTLPIARYLDLRDELHLLSPSCVVTWCKSGPKRYGEPADVDIALLEDLLGLLSQDDEAAIRKGLDMFDSEEDSPIGAIWATLAEEVDKAETGELLIDDDSMIARAVPKRFREEVALRALVGDVYSAWGSGKLELGDCLIIRSPSLRSLDGFSVKNPAFFEMQTLDLGQCPHLERIDGIEALPDRSNLERLILPSARQTQLQRYVDALPSHIDVQWIGASE